jgi:hypothetical protein
VAYGSGSPFFRRLDLIRLGSRSPRKLAGFGSLSEQLAGTAIAADPAGRLWVSWFYGNGSGPGLFVRRSNPAAGTFGPAERVALPPGTSTVFKVYASAQDGLLDLVALISRHDKDGQAAYWATEVLPPLALAAARSSAHGARVTLTVTDAGSRVRGATVRLCGHRAVTPASGKVSFRVASVRHGRTTATAAKNGFAGARLALRATC